MKKTFLLMLCFVVISYICFAGKFVLVPVTENSKLETLFKNSEMKIHYTCEEFVLATTNHLNYEGLIILDEDAFEDVKYYMIIYNVEANSDLYLAKTTETANILYIGRDFLIVKVVSENFFPDKNDKITTINNIEISVPRAPFSFPEVTEVDPFILSVMNKVNTDTLLSFVQHLQDYGTRAYNEPQAVLAQNWMKAKFESYGLDVEIQNVSVNPGASWSWSYYPHANSLSGNVIAVQTGTKYPNEYIICGAHYDSWAWYNAGGSFAPNKDIAPGADDNATGTASIIELARIMSQYESERTIIYCAFAAEEFGLWGSKAYASRCSQQGMNILGYFNIDMSGYLAPGAPNITISIIRNLAANPLAYYYRDVASVYFPEVRITHHEMMEGGDSDHTSFVNNGYQGIYPFEDNTGTPPNIYYSPYIHRPTDVVGTSVNNPEQMGVFAKATLASIAILANMSVPAPPLAPPTNCLATYHEELGYNFDNIDITWDAPTEYTPDEYFVYRKTQFEEEMIKINQTTDTSIKDWYGTDGTVCYRITAIYNGVESELSNESCVDIPIIDGITEYSSNFKIYPNPAKDELRIVSERVDEWTSGRVDGIEIYDIFGRKQKAESRKGKFPSNSLEGWQPQADGVVINLSHLTPGIYFVKISNEMVGKFIKE